LDNHQKELKDAGRCWKKKILEISLKDQVTNDDVRKGTGGRKIKTLIYRR